MKKIYFYCLLLLYAFTWLLSQLLHSIHTWVLFYISHHGLHHNYHLNAHFHFELNAKYVVSLYHHKCNQQLTTTTVDFDVEELKRYFLELQDDLSPRS